MFELNFSLIKKGIYKDLSFLEITRYLGRIGSYVGMAINKKRFNLHACLSATRTNTR